MNEVVELKPQTGVVADMAQRFGMDPRAFELTVRKICLPPDRRTGQEASREEFAAFLLVARQHGLNPLTREIYGFRTKSGSIQPVVGIDGWMKLINENPQFDGFETEDKLDDKGNVIAITCRMFRKDRTHPITATEYLSECRQPTSEVWDKWPRRMLRHKVVIQTARYAFGFSGIVDQDEAARFIPEASHVTIDQLPPSPPEIESVGPSVPRLAPAEATGVVPPAPAPVATLVDEEIPVPPQEAPEDVLRECRDTLATATTPEEVEQFYSEGEYDSRLEHTPYGVSAARNIKEENETRVAMVKFSPFDAIPDEFETASDYHLWIDIAIKSVADRASAGKLREAWNTTKEWRAKLISQVDNDILKARVVQTIAPYATKATEKPVQAQEPVQAVQTPPESETPPEASSVDIWAKPSSPEEYYEQCKAVEKMVDRQAIRKWMFDTEDARADLGIQQAPEWRKKWKAALVDRINDLEGK
jgi:phage recombination protein Bet